MSDYNNLDDVQCEAFARNLARFREELSEVMGKPVTQETLADMSGVRLDTLRAYERRRRRPKLAPLLALAKALRRPVEDLVAVDPPPLDRRNQAPFLVRTKLYGTPPPGLQEELNAVIERYSRRTDAIHANKARGRRGKKV